MLRNLYGINIAVKDLDAAVAKYAAILDAKPEWTKPEDFAFPGMKGCVLKVAGVSINLISASQPDPANSVYRFLEKNGDGVFLLSFQSSDLVKDMPELAKKGVKLISPDKPISYSGGIVNFGHPKSLFGVQMEFIEPGGKMP